ncbi:YoaK family protein [Methylophilus methylotrophus]|uniref:YoaK family protein n=1 Tax=Methylophilus methylotrophus TaxID=17 RepID=UPI000360C5F4|nr:YoaK family protein [Methylophilus methylotrophus]
MMQRLPRWVEWGGFLLAMNAGFVNAVGVLGFRHQAVSHLTGISTYFSIELVNQDAWQVLHLLWVILFFVLGAILSGVLIGNEALRIGRRYHVALWLEAGLLAASVWLLSHGWQSGQWLASAACGLQNAMTSTFSGAVVRTTHVSGLFTDIGIALGLRLRGQAVDRRRLLLYTLLIAGFICGGVLGVWGYLHWHFNALLLPAAHVAALSVSYYGLSRRH